MIASSTVTSAMSAGGRMEAISLNADPELVLQAKSLSS